MFSGCRVLTSLYMLCFIVLSSLYLCTSLISPVFCFILLTRAFIGPESGGIMGFLVRHISFLRSKDRQISQDKARQIVRQLSQIDLGGADTEPENTAAIKAAQEVDPPVSPQSPGSSGEEQLPAVKDLAAASGAPLDAATRKTMQRELMRHAIMQRERADTYGYLFIKLKEKKPLFRMWTIFVVNLTYALSTNLTTNTEVQLFILGLVSSTTLTGVLLQQPFVTAFANRRNALVQSFTLAHVIVTLASIFDSSRMSKHPYFVILVVLWSVLTLAIFTHRIRRWMQRRAGARPEGKDEPEVELADAAYAGAMKGVPPSGEPGIGDEVNVVVEKPLSAGSAERERSQSQREGAVRLHYSDPAAAASSPASSGSVDGARDSSSSRRRTGGGSNSVADSSTLAPAAPSAVTINGEEHILMSRSSVASPSLGVASPSAVGPASPSVEGQPAASTPVVRMHTGSAVLTTPPDSRRGTELPPLAQHGSASPAAAAAAVASGDSPVRPGSDSSVAGGTVSEDDSAGTRTARASTVRIMMKDEGDEDEHTAE
jgi:hypothetical protein